jgi:hypothetical protein
MCCRTTRQAAVTTHLDAQVDMLCDSESKVSSLGKVALSELVLLDLEATLEAVQHYKGQT